MNEIGAVNPEHTRFRAGAEAVERLAPIGRVEQSEVAAPRPLSHEELSEKLDFDERTGVFTWRVSPHNRVPARSVAGHLLHDGTRVIGIRKRHYTAPRLAHFYVHGEWPAEERLIHDPVQALAGKPIKHRDKGQPWSAAQRAARTAQKTATPSNHI